VHYGLAPNILQKANPVPGDFLDGTSKLSRQKYFPCEWAFAAAIKGGKYLCVVHTNT
jgi:hypothetical protein